MRTAIFFVDAVIGSLPYRVICSDRGGKKHAIGVIGEKASASTLRFITKQLFGN